MYENKKVLIFGLGLNDGGLGMAEYFLKEGALVTITDMKSEEELKAQIEVLSEYENVQFHLGRHIEKDFIEHDIIIRNPAIKPDNKYLRLARNSGKEIVMEMALFHKVASSPIIGITGTRGKSTTTTLIYEILKDVYKEKVFLGGNIGKSAIRELPNLSKHDIAVLELSSFQLDGMGESTVSPHIAVVTNLYKDHIDWHGSMDEYIKAKKNIFLHQIKDDYLVVNIDNDITKEFVDESPGKVITFSLKDKEANYYMDDDLNVYENGKEIFKLDNLKLKGEHNHYNILAAVSTARIYDIPVESIKKVVESFEGVTNRQEFVRELDGVKYYNDTCATSVEAMLAMFNTFGEKYKGKIVMIAGGVDKGLEYELLLNDMRKYLKSLVLFEGTASEKIDTVVGPYVDTHKYFDSMKGAIDKARELANEGDMVILCPGASSFNMFINEFDRGKQFVDYVNSL
ncbi:MAG: UDP-N-acetylmuramoylalanine--D-glutamate ligase [candidate division WS6 bacterium 34_10]|uniref:UDP-N-acetylmuramoylalanine--D-glutamate ligase n=1 Tax=candidate division WS6 bacterium 34_10 TaxID=1641389 RepID=A0A101HGF1_9BACT|nr:MAG: UDP-N-acetylmuramoylalanine--D-glutamate ligase [candidate division WS6 bacterium 34_10]